MQLNNIKRRMLFTLSFLLITTSVQAQPGRGQQGPPSLPNKAQIADMIEELDQALELTTNQKAQISGLYFAHFEETQKVMDTDKTSPQDTRQTMEALRKHFQAEVKVLLNRNQVKKFESLQKNQRPPQQGKRRI